MVKYIVVFVVLLLAVAAPVAQAEVVAEWVDEECVEMETVLLSKGKPAVSTRKVPGRVWSCDRRPAGIRCTSVMPTRLNARDAEFIAGKMTRGAVTTFITEAWTNRDVGVAAIVALKDDGRVLLSFSVSANTVMTTLRCIGRHKPTAPPPGTRKNTY